MLESQNNTNLTELKNYLLNFLNTTAETIITLLDNTTNLNENNT